MMTKAEEKKLDRLTKDWEQKKRIADKLAKNAASAVAAYHWTEKDSGAKWNAARAAQENNRKAFIKANAAFEELTAYYRELLRKK
jgi:hypothetical protein